MNVMLLYYIKQDAFHLVTYKDQIAAVVGVVNTI
ncbi:hypothetical protein BAR153v2_013670 [Bartonella sp. AR 15-3]|nr:hypothetical protein BAR153v2_013670 [Bartonella sp. AR 15-3]